MRSPGGRIRFYSLAVSRQRSIYFQVVEHRWLRGLPEAIGQKVFKVSTDFFSLVSSSSLCFRFARFLQYILYQQLCKVRSRWLARPIQRNTRRSYTTRPFSSSAGPLVSGIQAVQSDEGLSGPQPPNPPPPPKREPEHQRKGSRRQREARSLPNPWALPIRLPFFSSHTYRHHHR
jgi:hypothetical protein